MSSRRLSPSSRTPLRSLLIASTASTGVILLVRGGGPRTATGTPCFVIVIVSPRRARASSSLRWAFASYAPIVFICPSDWSKTSRNRKHFTAEEAAPLCEAAREALDHAKSEGRGRVAIYVEEKMVLKSNYYSRAQLARLSGLARALAQTEASLLRLALTDLLNRHRELT